jgi:excisionase family DNA binding protein
MSDPTLLTVREVAGFLRLRPVTVYQWIWKKRIRYVKVGRTVRIPQSEVERLTSNVIPAKA